PFDVVAVRADRELVGAAGRGGHGPLGGAALPRGRGAPPLAPAGPVPVDRGAVAGPAPAVLPVRVGGPLAAHRAAEHLVVPGLGNLVPGQHGAAVGQPDPVRCGRRICVDGDPGRFGAGAGVVALVGAHHELVGGAAEQLVHGGGARLVAGAADLGRQRDPVVGVGVDPLL